MVNVVDDCRYDVGCIKTFNNFKKKNKVFLKITSKCSKLYIYSISNFFGGLFLLFLFPTGRVHSQFKSTKVFFIKVGGGHTILGMETFDFDGLIECVSEGYISV